MFVMIKSSQLFQCIIILAQFVLICESECANACNGHGRCTGFDMCICYRNWQSNDCSERVCQFGLAHVDTPKGDLNMDGMISGPDEILVQNSFVYPYGTTEGYPGMQNSDLEDIENSAHYYMECSNKGLCDRQTGTCKCFEGFDGAACQRASCPGHPKTCSGHGVCKTVKQLATSDYENIYELWDKDSTMGCQCDSGFIGPDCSLRECKYGIDPLYIDDFSTVKYSTFNFALLTTGPSKDFTDGSVRGDSGYWQLRFFDIYGEDWYTVPLAHHIPCSLLVDAINMLPNHVIPTKMYYDQCLEASEENVSPMVGKDKFEMFDPTSNSLPNITNQMFYWIDGNKDPYTVSGPINTNYKLSGYLFRVKFNQNPGKLREPEINIYVEGKRPYMQMPGEQVITKVWTDGNQGENDDHFSDYCDGVGVTITNDHKFGEMTSVEKNILKACLGDSDFDRSNNIDVYNWDEGSDDYPHLVKLVLATASIYDGGYYVSLKYNNVNDEFELLQPFKGNEISDVYEVFTTRGTLARASNKTRIAVDYASKKFYMINSTVDEFGDGGRSTFSGDLSCETSDNYWVTHCLSKSDIVTFLDPDVIKHNPERLNLYTINKLYRQQYNDTTFTTLTSSAAINFGMQSNILVTDLSSNFGYGLGNKDINYQVYKFFPSLDSTYTYVARCSNRGICNEQEGLCECFNGYGGDACSDHISLSI